jgi:hypothetical protein
MLKDIEIPDIVAEAFEQLLNYAYTGELSVSGDYELLLGIYYAGL